MKEEILKALSHVEDPDLKKDLVTLNMIQKLEIEEGKVSFDLVLTTPACPMKDLLERACRNAIRTMVSPDIEIAINVTSQVTSTRHSDGMLSGVKNVVAVASGKGGVGKSTVSIQLAKALARTGASVGILDADIHGPSIPVLLGEGDARPSMDGEVMLPIDHQGMKIMSIGFLVPKEQAVVWRGPMLSSALKQFSSDVRWGELDYLIIDLPPGTGDVHLSMLQMIPLNGILVVTTPDEVAVADARKAVNMYQNPQLTQHIVGLVENMSFFSPDGDNKYYLFGENGGTQLAQEAGLQLLEQIPIVEKDKTAQNDVVFDSLAGKVAQDLSIQNAVN